MWLEEAIAPRNRKLRAVAPMEQAVELALARHWLAGAATVARLLTPASWAAMGGLREATPIPAPVNTFLDRVRVAMEGSGGRLADVFRTQGTLVMRAAHAHVIEDVGVVSGAFHVKHPIAVAYLERHGARRVSAIDEETRSRIRTILVDAVGKGESYQTVAKRLISLQAEFAVPSPLGHIRSRGELIAVTEMGDAYTAGTLAAADEMRVAGLVMEKRWLTVGDSRVDDPICHNNESGGWIPLRDSFPSGHEGPTGHPGCRCSLQTRRAKH